MTATEEAFVSALVGALVRDLGEHPVPGGVARIVIRWFEADDPLYLTVHVLGSDERDGVAAGDAWHPLEWDARDRELERTDRVVEDPAVQAAGAPLEEEYADPDDEVDDAYHASPALIEVARRLPGALREASIPVTDDVLALTSQFEGVGTLNALGRVDPPAAVVAALRERGELPDE
jgi:hypothetical protein